MGLERSGLWDPQDRRQEELRRTIFAHDAAQRRVGALRAGLTPPEIASASPTTSCRGSPCAKWCRRPSTPRPRRPSLCRIWFPLSSTTAATSTAVGAGAITTSAITATSAGATEIGAEIGIATATATTIVVA